MTIDEAIKDLEHGTEQLEMEIKSGLWIKGSEPELHCKEGIVLNKQHIEWLKELKEAKRLLKMAVEDINFYVDCYEAHCDECCCSQDNHCHWKHEAEALKLIGEDEDENS